VNLQNSVALVTGGSSGIGRAIAQTLKAAGARVAITGRDEKRLSEAAASLGAFPIRADASDEADVERTYREVLKQFGDLDVLVNNAGFGIFKNLVDFDKASFDSVFATNVTGAMLMGREAARIFIKRQRGNIVNIASTAALRGAANGMAYYASKFALRGMSECWRAELRRHNIRVFLVNPSEVITDFAARAGFAHKVNDSKLRGEEIAHIVKAILEMWLPGQEGGTATANVLLGKAVPGGKLPITFPADVTPVTDHPERFPGVDARGVAALTGATTETYTEGIFVGSGRL
jgi:3-oxoacyl-[acyl-carrier protein] reductase